MRRRQFHLVLTFFIFLSPFVIGDVLTEDINLVEGTTKRFCLISNDNSSESDSSGSAQYEKLNRAQYFKIVSDHTQEEFETRPTIVFIHGWITFLSKSDSENGEFTSIAGAYKKFHPNRFNLVVVNWDGGLLLYPMNYIRFKVAPKVAEFLDEKLGWNEKAWRNLKIIGHSLGAHLAGFIGKNVKRGKVGTIIGLDVARPLYEGTAEKDRLAKNDANYTECIITNRLCFGMKQGNCQVNFYLNEGNAQPGCDDNSCDHSRAHQYFADSLSHNTYRGSQQNRKQNLDKPGSCSGAYAYMGGEPGNKDRNIAKGNYYLSTWDSRPFGKGPVQKNSYYCEFQESRDYYYN